MDKDRTVIYKIISDMLKKPDEHGMFPTSTAFIKLEHYIEVVRTEAIGWCHANDCISLDQGNDPRLADVPNMLMRAQRDLAG